MDLTSGLTAAQVEAVTSARGPVAIIAGPGAGKTRVLTRRVAFRCREASADPGHTLVLTFSRRAARELFERLGPLGLPVRGRRGGVSAGTFHAMAWAELARHRADRGAPPPALISRRRRLLAPALAGVLGRDPWATEVAAAATEIAWARARCLEPDGYVEQATRAGRLPGRLDADVLVAAWPAYERAKQQLRVLDLDDLLLHAALLLEQDGEAAAIAQWRHRHVFVDEYQDLNPAHRRLLRAIVGDRPDVCLVGDPEQAVYGFNGSDPDLFARLDADWPGVHVITLPDNFRSSPEVVAIAAAVRPSTAAPHVSRRPPGPVPLISGYRTAEDEAAAAAAHAASLPGRGRGRAAILARTNARLRVVAAALDAIGVPWRLRDPRPLTDRAGVRTWLDCVPPAAPVADLAEYLDDADPSDADAAALASALAEYRDLTVAATVGRFTDWLDAAGVTADEGEPGGVDLVTFHRAKGLEWDDVWIAGVEGGLVPLDDSDPETLAEEQRLLYVAVTRAASSLHVSWAVRPSRWIADLDAAVAGMCASLPPAEHRRRLADLAGTPVRARHDALLAWRATRARAAIVPPQVILPDRVIEDLANSAADSEAAVLDIARPLGGQRAVLWAAELVEVLRLASMRAA